MSEIQTSSQKKSPEEDSNFKDNLWFKRKLFGCGWTPCSWEGWTIFIIFVAYITIKITLFREIMVTGDTYKILGFLEFYDLIDILALSSLFILICYIKGEKPKWQWGKRRD